MTVNDQCWGILQEEIGKEEKSIEGTMANGHDCKRVIEQISGWNWRTDFSQDYDGGEIGNGETL